MRIKEAPPAKVVSIEKFNKITDAPQGKVKKEQVWMNLLFFIYSFPSSLPIDGND